MKIKRLTFRIVTVALLGLLTLAVLLMCSMTYFMESLTDALMLNTLQPLAKTAARDVEGNLHTLVDRFFLIRDNPVLASKASSERAKREVLAVSSSGIEFEWLALYELDGALAIGSENAPRNIVSRKLFSELHATSNLSIEDTSIGVNGLEIAMGVPVIAPDAPRGEVGEAPPVAAYLVGSYKYDILSDVLRNINISTNGAAFITNIAGEIIAHREFGKVFSHENVSNTLGDSPSARQVIRAMLLGQTGATRVVTPDGHYFISYAPISGTRWSLAIHAPRSDFLGPTRQGLYTGMAITVVLFLVFVVIMSFVLRHILAKPLLAITDSARHLALGLFDSSLPPHITDRADEIGQLAKAFATMSNSVRGVVHDIGRLTQAARAGGLGERADAAAYHGDYRLIIAGINATLDVMCSYLETMPGAVVLFDVARRPLYLNRAMRDILARHHYAADDRDLLALVLTAGASRELEAQAQALFSPCGAAISMQSTQVTMPGADGQVYTYALSLGRVEEQVFLAPLDTDATICVMLLLNDITQLTRARIEAESASRAKSDFLSRMSHEIRTPMNAIIGMTAIGKAANDIQRKEYCLNKINEASQHLLGVINDILDMSKIEADKFELTSHEFHFEKMLQRVTNVINFRVEEMAQNLLIELDNTLPASIVTDEQRLAQVMTNLLSNAVKFTPENGSITLKVDALSEDDAQCTLRVMIKDSGIGIAPEQQARLFSSFEQADGSISRKYGGTGLGLAISRRIIELMGGRIWVESALGQGAAFIFEMTVPKGKKTPGYLTSQDADWKNLRVLVVDDVPEILDRFRFILAPYGVECVTAVSGAEALGLMETCHTKPFDIVFVDWRMPVMSGIELTRQIMTMQEPPPVAVLVTAADWSEVEAKARAVGISHFLQKPIFPSMLVDCINECMVAHHLTDPIAAPTGQDHGLFTGKHILLAEDVAINREIAQALLEHTGIDIDFAFDGAQAVAKFTADPNRYKLVLMDVHMPNMDGYEATTRIRSAHLPRARSIPIIAMTANVFREDIERCLACGMNAHLGKPIDAEELIRTLKRYMR